jgi:hypothetical protein
MADVSARGHFEGKNVGFRTNSEPFRRTPFMAKRMNLIVDSLQKYIEFARRLVFNTSIVKVDLIFLEFLDM